MNIPNYVRLPLRNAYNARDLGGYPCDGGATNWHAFVRTDGLERLDNEDIRFLMDYGIRTVIDLRSADELASAPDPDGLKAFAEYVNIPLIPGVAADITKITQAPPSGFLTEFYVNIHKTGHDALRAVMETIANAREGGVLFHCAAGKDRTGIVASLLLGLAGVARADILSNYETTHTYIRQNPAMTTHREEIPIEYLYSNRDYLEPALDYVQSQGGTRTYLRKIGVSGAALRDIRARLGCVEAE